MSIGASGVTKAGVSKAYVDAVAQGLSVKESVKYASTAALGVAYDYVNGVAGVGATITKHTAGALAAQDGQAPAVGDRFLVKNEIAGNAPFNGIYTVTDPGGATPFVLTRAKDADTAGKLEGAYTFVEDGTVNNGAGFVLPLDDSMVVGTTAQTWTQFSGASWGLTHTTATYVQPASGATVSIAVADSSGLAPGGEIFVVGGGFYTVIAVPDGTHATVLNTGTAQNAAPTSVVAQPAAVTAVFAVPVIVHQNAAASAARVMLDTDESNNYTDGAVFVGSDATFQRNYSWIRLHPISETTIGILSQAYFDVGPQTDEVHVNETRNFSIVGDDVSTTGHPNYGGGNSPHPAQGAPPYVTATFDWGPSQYPPFLAPLTGVHRWVDNTTRSLRGRDKSGNEAELGPAVLAAAALGGTGKRPTIVPGAGLGANGTTRIDDGTDVAFTVTLHTSAADTPGASADLATITLAKARTLAPYVQLTPANDAAWNLAQGVVRVRASDVTPTTLKLRSGPTPLPATTAADYLFYVQISNREMMPPLGLGLRAWYRGDQLVAPGALVQAAGNLASGTDANTIVTAAGAAQPTLVASDAAYHNQPLMTFDGVNQRADSGTWASPVALPITMYWVGEASVVGGTLLQADSTGLNNYIKTRDNSGAGGSAHGINLCGILDGAPTLDLRSRTVLCAVLNGVNTAGYVNDATTPIVSGDGSAAQVPVDLVALGWAHLQGVRLTGKIAEVLVYAGAHDQISRTVVMRYLATRYAITVGP
jgi:hypothetical protein